MMTWRRSGERRPRRECWRRAIWVALAGLILATGRMAAAPPDEGPVGGVRQVLRAPVADPCADSPEVGRRREALRRASAALARPSDLAAALLLSDWRDEDVGEAVAAVDRAARREVAERFEGAVRALLQRDDPAGQLAAIDLALEVVAGLKPGAADGWTPRGLGPDLAELGRSPESAVRAASARALGLVRADPAVAVPALRALLQDGDPTPRRAAAGALVDLMARAGRAPRAAGGLGPSVAEVIEVGRAVVRAASRGLSDPDVAVRQASLLALAQTAAATENVLAAPRASPDGGARPGPEADLAAIAPLARDLKELTSGLTVALNDPDPGLRLLARRTLEQFGTLQRRLEGGPGPGLSVLQARHVEGPGEPPRPLLERVRASVPALAAGISDPDVRARRAAIDALENLGEEATPAGPALLQALADPDPFVRWSAARTLGRLRGVDAGKVVGGLRPLLGDRDLDVRLAAAGALGRRGPGAADAVPALTRAAATGDPVLRVAAIEALGAIGAAAKSALPVLAESLSASDARVRKAAATVLGGLGESAGEFQEVLRAAAADPDVGVRKAVRDALLAGGPRQGAGAESSAPADTPALATVTSPPAEQAAAPQETPAAHPETSAAHPDERTPARPQPVVAAPMAPSAVSETEKSIEPASPTGPAPAAPTTSPDPGSVPAPAPPQAARAGPDGAPQPSGPKSEPAAWEAGSAAPASEVKGAGPAATSAGFMVPAGGAWAPPSTPAQAAAAAPQPGLAPPAVASASPVVPPPSAMVPPGPGEPIAISSPAPSLRSTPAAAAHGPAPAAPPCFWRPTPPGQVIASSADPPRPTPRGPP